jgi:hypothetical protein
MRKFTKQTTSVVMAKGKTSADSAAARRATFDRAATDTGWAPPSWPFNPQDVSPIEWWRSMPADCLGDAQHLQLRTTLDKICVMNGREWLAAMYGDAAASIAIAFEMSPITVISLELDLAMTVLLLRALGGNAAATLVLSHLLCNAPLDHPFAKELSVSWLVLNLHRAFSKPKRCPELSADTDKPNDSCFGTVIPFVGRPA